METNKIYQGDCLELMKQIEDNSIDLIITDPPYNWGKNFENDNMEETEYWKWLNNVFEELFRISNGWIVVDIPRTKLINFQNIICKKFLFYDYFCLAVNNSMANCGLGIDRFSLKIVARKSEEFKVKNRKSNLFITHRISGNNYKRNYFNHPTQKDLKGYRYVIEMLSNKGDIVLDCFLGSGTTAVACKHLDRDFIGIEIDEEYIKIANKRLSQQTLTKLQEGGNSSQP